jgi:hypothetical protein
MNYRLYTFVANHYISPLQCGLQTAHVVSELSLYKTNTQQHAAFESWASMDKTIIICGAGNHAGVVACYDEIQRTASALDLPFAIFREDEQSMNGMATACGVIVPQKYYDAKFVPPDGANASDASIFGYWEYIAENGARTAYWETHPEGQFIQHIKSFRLA